MCLSLIGAMVFGSGESMTGQMRQDVRTVLVRSFGPEVLELPVFCTPEALAPGTKVYHAYSTALTVPDDGWYHYVWIDLVPPESGAMWAHPVRVVFVPAELVGRGLAGDASVEKRVRIVEIRDGGPPMIPERDFVISYSHPRQGMEHLVSDYRSPQ